MVRTCQNGSGVYQHPNIGKHRQTYLGELQQRRHEIHVEFISFHHVEFASFRRK
jgi:hypothetical protein